MESSPLSWDGRRLDFGPPATETVVRSVDGIGMVTDLERGDWVSLHWEWVCDKLTDQQVARLRNYTQRHLKIVNETNLHSGPSALLDAGAAHP